MTRLVSVPMEVVDNMTPLYQELAFIAEAINALAMLDEGDLDILLHSAMISGLASMLSRLAMEMRKMDDLAHLR